MARLKREQVVRSADPTPTPAPARADGGRHPVLDLQRMVGNGATAAAVAGADPHAQRAVEAVRRPDTRARGIAELAERGDAETLIRHAGSSWSSVKALYLGNPQLMTKIVAFRKNRVDAMIEQLQREHPGMKTRAAGSNALSSDYDITFMGESGAVAVQKFNERFRTYWGKEAGTLFDTNVYAEDVLPDKETVVGGKDDITKLGSTSESANVDARLDEGLQDVSSLVKVRKNMTREAWNRFTALVVDRLRDSRDLSAEAAARFAQANTIYERTYIEQILTKLEADPASKAALQKLRADGKSNIAAVEAMMGDDTGIAASNRVYEEKLLYAAELEQRRKEAKNEREWKSLTVDLRKAKADAMLFANEPYFSAGTLYHVVGNTQANFGAALSSAALFQSLEENYGDTLKELHHLHGKKWEDVAIKSSKYVWRMLDAAAYLQKDGMTFEHDIEKLRAAAKVAFDVRQGKGGSTTEAAAVKVLEGVGIGSEEKLTEVLEKIVADATVSFRRSSP